MLQAISEDSRTPMGHLKAHKSRTLAWRFLRTEEHPVLTEEHFFSAHCRYLKSHRICFVCTADRPHTDRRPKEDRALLSCCLSLSEPYLARDRYPTSSFLLFIFELQVHKSGSRIHCDLHGLCEPEATWVN